MHHQVWGGGQLPGLHGPEGGLHGGGDDAGGRPVVVVPGEADRRAPPGLLPPCGRPRGGQVLLHSPLRLLPRRQAVPLQALSGAGVLRMRYIHDYVGSD